MLCDRCKKKEATIHIKEVHNGKCTTTNLCADCAREKEIQEGLGAFGFNLAEVLFNVGKLSGAISGSQPEGTPPAESSEKQIVCPNCGWSLEKMRATSGKLGCPECYKVFSKMIHQALLQVQRGTVHLGKMPRSIKRSAAGVKFEMEKLREEQKNAIATEEYEQAAICRDRLNALAEELKQLESPNESGN